MNIDFSVQLPTDAQSVPLVRGLLRQALEHLHVTQPVIEEITLALTEACANVVDHAADHEDYQVDVSIDEQLCTISVLDDGAGFDVASATETDPAPTDDRGRGLMLMRALVDRLRFVEGDDGRHRVTFEKRLVTQPRLRLRLLEPH
ncbi:ATP-binding protein [Blastococcus capsensis]|uniref:ATP-binding protein n=1 Tax=Blastococcus capsensis TaxID=1564163 RepID=UPI0025413F5A|nr:ATP-binding protein [Blastococcus capsensis]MDK3256554.1 ATP-binding protein [Blastococcus capsensis]